MANPHPPARRRGHLARRCAAASATIGLTAGLLAAGAATAGAATAEPDQDLASRFTFAVLPDTQFYSRYSASEFIPRFGADPFAVQTQWLAQNADELRIPFVAHLGDIVDRATVAEEWQAADAAMSTLERAGLPYSVLPGNHDVRNSDDRLDDTDYNLDEEPYLDWFGPERAAAQATYGGSDATGLSQYHVFEAEGQEFLVLALPWRASDQTLEWADAVMAQHPTAPVILTTHSLLAIDSDQTSPLETPYGDELWEKLIRDNDQIFLTLNGHSHGATRLTKTNDFGHEVTQILMDYQMAQDGGNGYLGLFEFDLTNNAITVQTASPWVTFKPQEVLTPNDQPFLEGEHQQFTIDIDFRERFGGFDPDFGAGTADEPSLSRLARDILLDGFEGPDAITTAQPGREDDFVEAEGTLAHWRFHDLEGVVDDTTVVEDIAGDNDLRRADTSATGAEPADVTVQKDDVHGFSSDGAAVCFDNSDRRTGRFSYLTTAADAALNDADLTGGYTIETFVKMDADWTADANQWSKFLTRTGNRSQIPGAVGDRWSINTSPMAFGISNLREFQFTSLPGNVGAGDKVNWSGEIMVDTWAHVAVVNDAEAGTTTMYVDGAPVLRNASGAHGMAANAGMPWILGADYADDAYSGGWHGCIGETRIIDRPTGPQEWLTQRRDITGPFAVTEAPSGELPADTAAVTFAGTGEPGTEVRLSPVAASEAVAARAALSGAEAEVGADGTWQIEVTEGLGAGSHEIALAPAIGTRAGDPVVVGFAIAPAAEPTTPPASPAPSPSPSDPAADDGDGDPAASGDPADPADGDLAATGADGAFLPIAATVGMLLLVAGGATLLLRRRRAGRMG